MHIRNQKTKGEYVIRLVSITIAVGSFAVYLAVIAPLCIVKYVLRD